MGASLVSGALAIDATNVYWATTNNASIGTVWKTPIGGGQSATIVSGMLNPTVLAIDPANVYWCDSREAHDVVSAPLAGGGTTTLFGGGMSPYDLAVGSSAVYFWVAPSGSAAQLTEASLDGGALDGGAPSTLATAAIEGPLAIGGSTLYWADQNGDVGSIPLAGGSAMTLVTGSASNYVEGNIVVDATSVYWSQNDIGTGVGYLLSVPLAGGTPTTLTSGPQFAGIAVDSSTVYFTSNDPASGTGALATVPLAGGTVTTLVPGTSGMNAVVVDKTSVYWTNVTTGILAKMPK
jgi:hypothetical protein